MACFSPMYVNDASPPPRRLSNFIAPYRSPIRLRRLHPSGSVRLADVCVMSSLFPPRRHNSSAPRIRFLRSATHVPGLTSEIPSAAPRATSSTTRTHTGAPRRVRASLLSPPHRAPRRSSSPIPDAVEFDAPAPARAVAILSLNHLPGHLCPSRPSVRLDDCPRHPAMFIPRC